MFGAVGMDGANRMAELEQQRQIARPLQDLERLITVNAARSPERKALRSRICRRAGGKILRALVKRRGLIGNLVPIHHARARRTILRGQMRLQAVVSRTERLPDAGKIGFPVSASRKARGGRGCLSPPGGPPRR